MLWAVAARYGFSEAEVLSMPAHRLRFWYAGHTRMVEEERAAVSRAVRR